MDTRDKINVQIRLTTTEYYMLKELAKLEGLNATSYLRHLIYKLYERKEEKK